MSDTNFTLRLPSCSETTLVTMTLPLRTSLALILPLAVWPWSETTFTLARACSPLLMSGALTVVVVTSLTTLIVSTAAFCPGFRTQGTTAVGRVVVGVPLAW